MLDGDQRSLVLRGEADFESRGQSGEADFQGGQGRVACGHLVRAEARGRQRRAEGFGWAVAQVREGVGREGP